MSESLFFAYTKTVGTSTQLPTFRDKFEECPACGSLITVGSWPFCSGHNQKDEFKNRKESE